MHPVDELAAIRSRIKTLRSREAVLRKLILAGKVDLQSNRHRVELRSQVRRVFLREQLPADVLADPALWEERQSQTVTVRDMAAMPTAPDDIVLVVPFDD